MRFAFKIVGIAPIAFALVACGGSPKQADDASSQNTAKTDDEGAPKWDSSSTTTAPSSSSSSSSSGGDTAASGASPNGSSSSTGTTDTSATAAVTTANAGPHNEAEVALKRAARQAKANCGAAKDADGKATGPFGKTMVSLTLGRNGHSKAVTVDSSLDGKPAGNCVLSAFKNLTYAPWAGADATVQWEVELVQPK